MNGRAGQAQPGEELDLLRTLGDGARAALADAVAIYVSRRPGWAPDQGLTAPAAAVRLVEVVTVAGTLSDYGSLLVDVVAEADGRLLHVPVGLRSAQAPVANVGIDGEDVLLGLLDGDDAKLGEDTGTVVAFDAMNVGETVAALVNRLLDGAGASAELVRPVRIDPTSTTVAADDRFALTVFNVLETGPRAATEVLLALDQVGFNHLPAPLALWQRGDIELGIVQESLAGSSTGSALALTSVRDLYASGGAPELAGGDFGSEAHRLGVTTARMHLGFDEAYGRRPVSAGLWADAVADALAVRAPEIAGRADLQELLEQVRAIGDTAAIRTHGDFTLNRVWRNEAGWFVGDFGPGGQPEAGTEGPTPPTVVDKGISFRSPLADVADMMWSFSTVAASVASERDPDGRLGLRELGQAWEARNRAAFMAGYHGVPGIGMLLPSGHDATRALVALFEIERAWRGAPHVY